MRVDFAGLIRDAFFTGLSVSEPELPEILMEIPKRVEHGDFSSSAAMIYASKNRLKPREVASSLVAAIAGNDMVESVNVAGPGFINFTMKREFWHESIREIAYAGDEYGRLEIGRGQRIQVEFVSANPTGPLHIGHGRGAAIGDSLASILRFAGYEVQKEYYINDIGNQITTLGRSLRARLEELKSGVKPDMDGLYKGDYVIDLAMKLPESMASNPAGMTDAELGHAGQEMMLETIKEDLDNFGVTFESWFSEKTLHEGDDNDVDSVLALLEEKGYSYMSDDALWVRTTDMSDDKDRVAIRSNNEKTYFASDIAYHKNKRERGFDKVINIWGADHHGYIPRIMAVWNMLGYPADGLKILVVQLVSLYREGRQVVMSKRGGEFITLSEVIDEVGKDAARFFFLMRRADSSLDFDMDLAKKETNENPVYYVQYAHARLCSVFEKARGESIEVPDADSINLDLLEEPDEIGLIKQLTLFPMIVSLAARFMEPHRICFYLMDLAGTLHSYYFKHRIITSDRERTLARLLLMKSVRNTLKNGLEMIGVTAPVKM